MNEARTVCIQTWRAQELFGNIQMAPGHSMDLKLLCLAWSPDEASLVVGAPELALVALMGFGDR